MATLSHKTTGPNASAFFQEAHGQYVFHRLWINSLNHGKDPKVHSHNVIYQSSS